MKTQIEIERFERDAKWPKWDKWQFVRRKERMNKNKEMNQMLRKAHEEVGGCM